MTGILNALLGNTSNPFAGAALSLAFDQTTTLDSRITFTRATSGTFFNSTGVLSTASSGAARFDHRLEGGVWVNKGLLIEEARTNSSQRSEEISNAYWTKTNITVTADDTTAPDGTTTADKALETTTNGTHVFFTATPISLNMTSDNYTASVFVKGGLGRTRGVLQVLNQNTANSYFVNFNISPASTSTAVGGTGVAVGASIQDVGGGWYRVSISGRTGANGNHQVVAYIANDSFATSYAGDVTKGLYWWGVQLELGAFPTSYIKTTTASVTRNADVASMTSTDFSSWYNATEGTTFWQGDIVGSSANAKKAFSISDNSANERIVVSVENSSGNGFVSNVVDGNSSQASLETPNPATARTANQTYKHSFAYKVNDFAASLDGSSVQTDTSGTIPTTNRIYLGSNNAGTSLFLNGHIAKFYYWNTRKPNSFLQLVTG
jgi:hypothetical protein